MLGLRRLGCGALLALSHVLTQTGTTKAKVDVELNKAVWMKGIKVRMKLAYAARVLHGEPLPPRPCP